jgi:hypothetical protein
MNHPSNLPRQPQMPLRILIFFAVAMVIGAIVMLLWNALLPQLFGLHPITYWQAIGLLILVRILIGTYTQRGPFARIGMRPAWSEYEEWWRESGRKSYDEYMKLLGRKKSE